MKYLLALLFSSLAFAQGDGARILVGSAQPPLPFNIIQNTGFEDRTTAWTVTGGTFTTTQTFANVARGTFSASWTVPVSTTGYIFQAKDTALPAGLYGRSCIGSILYKGNAASNGDMVIEAYDGTTTYGTTALDNASTYTLIKTDPFTCPSTGNLRLRIRMTATCPTHCPSSPTAVYFDEAFLGAFEDAGGAGGGQYEVTTASVTAASSIDTGSPIRQIIYVTGSGGAVTASSSAPLSDGTTSGYERVLIGTSDTLTVTIPAGTNMKMNGPCVLGNGNAISFIWDGSNSFWVETSRR